MYPNLSPPLLVSVAALLALMSVIAIRQPVARRLASRQFSRRRSEAVLAILGSTMATAIIAGALTVGDTLNSSVREAAYRTLGPIDERVLVADPAAGRSVARRLTVLTRNPDVDGVLSARVTDAAAAVQRGAGLAAEPRVLLWGMDLAAAGKFGGNEADSSGITGPTPTGGDVVINQPLASSLHVR